METATTLSLFSLTFLSTRQKRRSADVARLTHTAAYTTCSRRLVQDAFNAVHVYMLRKVVYNADNAAITFYIFVCVCVFAKRGMRHEERHILGT